VTRTPRTLAVSLLFALVVTGTACGGSGSDEAEPPTTTAAVAAGSDATDPAEPVDDASGDASGSGEGECVADSDQMSGSSTVVWDDGEVAPELTMTFGDDGVLAPETLTVPVGERFAIASPAGSGLRAVKVGCAGAQTVPGGVTAGFVIDTAGTYVIIDEAADDYAGAEVGSVTVE
jgi:hypothetical protein